MMRPLENRCVTDGNTVRSDMRRAVFFVSRHAMCEMRVEVIPAAVHFQIDVEVIGSLPEGGQWSHGSTSHIYFRFFHHTIAKYKLQMPIAAGKTI